MLRILHFHMQTRGRRAPLRARLSQAGFIPWKISCLQPSGKKAGYSLILPRSHDLLFHDFPVSIPEFSFLISYRRKRVTHAECALPTKRSTQNSVFVLKSVYAIYYEQRTKRGIKFCRMKFIRKTSADRTQFFISRY